MTRKNTSMEKCEDEAIGGDGIVTIRHMNLFLMEQEIVCM